MIDHLVRCPTEQEAVALVRCFGAARAFRCRVVVEVGEWDMSDPENPVEISPEVLAAGQHVWVALESLSDELRDLPDGNCRLIADRAAALDGDPGFMVYVAPDIGPDVLETAQIEPVPFGSGYPFRAIADA